MPLPIMAKTIRIVQFPRPARLHPVGVTFSPPREAEWPCFILIRCGGHGDGGRGAGRPERFQDLITSNS
jgi:hypothetical protein